jgi:hypothetical protein
MRNKAQLQTMETIAVLFVFFILLALAMIFYVGYANSQSRIDLRNTQRVLSTELALTVANLPELRASRQGIAGVNSIDIYKAEALSSLITSDESFKLIYNTKLGPGEVKLREIYPDSRNWTVYSNVPVGSGFVRPFFIPVSLYEPRSLQNPVGKHSFGILEVWYYG